jgi:hypothetical protein
MPLPTQRSSRKQELIKEIRKKERNFEEVILLISYFVSFERSEKMTSEELNLFLFFSFLLLALN